MKEVNTNNFEEIVIKSSKPVMVDFWAEWCGPCRMLGPVLEDVADEVADVTIVKVNVDDNSELSAQYGVRSIPAVFVLRGGEQVDKFVGLKNKNEVIDIILNNLDKESDEQED